MTPQTNRQSYPPEEENLPKGHPSRPDYDPESPEAVQWLKNQRALQHTSGLPPGYHYDPERPHGGLTWVDGVDPLKPWLEPLTGRDRRARRAPMPDPGPGAPFAKPATPPATPETQPPTA